jgi:hypothetical protein
LIAVLEVVRVLFAAEACKRDPALKVCDRGRHLGAGCVGDAPSFDLDSPHAAKTGPLDAGRCPMSGEDPKHWLDRAKEARALAE